MTAHPLNTKVYGDVAPDTELLDSVRKNGVIVPVLVDKDNHIISGHRRWLAAKELGIGIICSVLKETSCARETLHKFCVHSLTG